MRLATESPPEPGSAGLIAVLLSRTSLKAKLMLLAMATTGLVLIVVTASYGTLETMHSRREMERYASSEAGLLAANLAAPLLFQDKRAARQTLAALQALEAVVCAVALDVSGQPFAVYQRNPAKPAPGPALAVKEGLQYERGDLLLVRRVRLNGEALGWIAMRVEPRMRQERMRSLINTLFGVTLAAVLLGWLVSSRLQRAISAPIIELAETARQAGHGGNVRVRAVKRSEDEVGVLVDSFNEMLDQVSLRTRELHEQIDAKERARAELAEAQHRLIELSRKSGMAEVATSVLHNVGNVLNSVNVSATVVSSKVRESRVDNLVALFGMLQAHQGCLDAFLRDDPKGQRVLPYLIKLGDRFQSERQSIQKELEQLTEHVGHIKRIVSIQQNYAKVSGLVEQFSPSDLLEDAFRILQPGFDQHEIHLLKNFEEVPQITSDKHQVLQILLNLLRNAKQAIAERGKPERVIRVRVRRHGEGRVRIEVKDSGTGLSAENLTRIFAHGFTTKQDGHGFGLHSGALAAGELGGSLWAESEGPGSGATFTLELPLAGSAVRSTISKEGNV